MPRPSPQTTRTLAAVTALAGEPEGLSLTELARRLDESPSSCVHVLAAMADAGFVIRDATSRRYFLGPALILPGQVAAARYPSLEAARRETERLTRTLGVTCLVFADDGGHARLVHRTWDPRLAPPLVQLGDALPITPPLGTAFVAWAPEDDVAAWLARGGVRGAAAEEQRATLAAVRRLGYVVELRPSPALLVELERLLAEARSGRVARVSDELLGSWFVAPRVAPQASYEVGSLSLPVFDADGRVGLVVNLVGLPAELSGRDLRRIAAAGREAVDRAAVAAGGRAPLRRVGG